MNPKKGKNKPQSESERIRSDKSLEKEELDSSLFEDVDIDPSEKEKILSRLVVLQTIERRYSGPLPDVETFRGYEDVSPGASKIILRAFSEQSKHRIDQEKEILQAERDNRRAIYILNRNGQVFAFILAVLGMWLSTYLIYLDKNIAGGIFGATALIVVISLFIKGKSGKEVDQ